ncbi:hypothetical protein [Streptomyces sp. NBC_01207]|uniref:hypothetical protein n=1 Tax=Streptomyces sp. NBC_01207 TaxID=2903772 RepID=UPI002E0EFD30|nr:hypothetical protein OG457_00850 [Streptomyces sp. NBC_01207]
MNEQTTTTPRPQITTWALSQTGPCARCHTSMCRYGVGGNPLFKQCQQARQERLART